MRVVPSMSVRLKVPIYLLYAGPVIGIFLPGMLMDWREMAGRPTFRRLHGEERWSSFTGAWSGGRKVAEGPRYMGPDGRGDNMRGWILAACWLLASTAECVLTRPALAPFHLRLTPLYFLFFSSVYYLYHLVRRPRLILDFTLTLLFNHLVLTTYYSADLPTSLFFWAVVLGSSLLTLLLAEQMCVKREMTEGLVIASNNPDLGDVELGALRRD
jgi:protein SYS1